MAAKKIKAQVMTDALVTVRVPLTVCREMERAVKLSGMTRNRFIVTAVRLASEKMLGTRAAA